MIVLVKLNISLEIEEFVIQRAIIEETPIPKLFCEELDKVV